MATVAVLEAVGGHWTVEIGGALVGTRRNETAARHLATANGATTVAVRTTITRVPPTPAPCPTCGRLTTPGEIDPSGGVTCCWPCWERFMST